MMINQEAARKLAQGAVPTGTHGVRTGFDAGYIVEVSPSHDNGVLEMDTGERLAFAVADRLDGDAKDLNVGDHAWVTRSDLEHTSRELVCPRRNKILRVRLTPKQP